MIGFTNSLIYILNGTLQNCSAQNFSIFSINNSSFYLENFHFIDFHSLLIYSNLGLIAIDSCFFINSNSKILESDSAIKFEKQVSFSLKNSQFKNLTNFAKVIIFLEINLKLKIGDLFKFSHWLFGFKKNQ